MAFDELLGNDQLKANLISARSRGRLSHFYLICGPEGSGRHTLADALAQALMCEAPDGPCGHCRACRKIREHLHPDYILADDPSTRTVKVDFVREIRSDMFIRPNEGIKKIYLFPRAQDMGLEAQNALLKVLEEPPAYGVFLLLTDNPEKLLPTIRSRCVELKMQPLHEELLRSVLHREFPDAAESTVSAAIGRSGGYLGQARALMQGSTMSEQTRRFAACYAARDVYGLLELLVPMEKWKRDALIPMLGEWLELLSQALSGRAGLPVSTPEAADIAAVRRPGDLMGACNALRKAMEYARGNVSCAAVCGWLCWALR